MLMTNNHSRQFTYLKSGDHTTNLVSMLHYGYNNVNSENLKYKYDEKGNISEIRKNGLLVARYKYDGLSRLVREDNTKFEKTFIFNYDAGGNILSKLEYNFTLVDNLDYEEITQSIPYVYPLNGWKDRLMAYNGESFVYDAIGNPTTYRDKTLVWSHGRQLDKFADVEFTYNGSGIRTSKIANGFTTKYYLNGNKIIRQQDASNDMLFHYGADGLVGFSLNNNEYTYKKNAQNDIIGIYDASGTQICEYTYDAWGNQICKYLSNSGEYIAIEDNYVYNDISNINRFVAYKNPFRYRGYYYDFETGLYYLNSRYYDPQTGRFINADDISILSESKELINGLNLFAYCNNNPIMLTDTYGTSWWSDLWGGITSFFRNTWDVFVGTFISVALVVGGLALTILSAGALSPLGNALIGAGVGGFIGGIQSKLNGDSYWGGYLGGFVSGALTGLGAYLGPIGIFWGGTIGNIAGTIITDSLNGVNVINSTYLFRLLAISILSGFTAVGAFNFGNATNILKTFGFNKLFAAVTVWAEFMFSSLFDAIKSFIENFSRSIGTKKLYKF